MENYYSNDKSRSSFSSKALNLDKKFQFAWIECSTECTFNLLHRVMFHRE